LTEPSPEPAPADRPPSRKFHDAIGPSPGQGPVTEFQHREALGGHGSRQFRIAQLGLESIGLLAVRARRCRIQLASSNSVPSPTIFVFKIDDFRVSLESTAHSRITISYGANRGGANRVVVGYVRSLVATAGHAASPAGGLTSQDREALTPD